MTEIRKNGLIFRSYKNLSRYLEKVISELAEGKNILQAKEKAFSWALYQKRAKLTEEKLQEIRKKHQTHCYYCGVVVNIRNICPSCGSVFCEKHIDADKHKCVYILETRARIN